MTSIGDCRGGECAGTVVLGTLLNLLAPASMLFLMAGYAFYANVWQIKKPGVVWYASALNMILLYIIRNLAVGYTL